MFKKTIIFILGFSIVPFAAIIGAVTAELFENYPLLWGAIILFLISCFTGYMAIKGYKNGNHS